MARPKMAPGTWGEIHREKVKKDGVVVPNKWVAVCWYVPADAEPGQRKRARRYSPAGERDQHGAKAEAVLVEALPELVKGSVERPGAMATVGELLLDALSEVRKSPDEYARRTVDTYALVVEVLRSKSRKCIKEGHNHFGNAAGKPAYQLRAADLKSAVKSIEREHDRVMARHARTLLRKVGEHLTDTGAWDVNYASDIQFKRRKHGAASAANKAEARKVEMRALTASEVRALRVDMRTSEALVAKSRTAKKASGRTVAEYVESNDLADPIELLLWTGLRRSELLALLWSDFDAEARTLSVRHHLVRAGRDNSDGGHASELLHERDTKSSSAVRTIPLTDQAVDLLTRRRRDVMARRRVRSRAGVPDVIFPTSRGGLRDPDTFAESWRRVRGALGVEWLGLHGFRRSTAVLLHEQGVSLRVIANMLGHSTIDMTIKYVVSDGEGVPPEAVAGLSQLFAADS